MALGLYGCQVIAGIDFPGQGGGRNHNDKGKCGFPDMNSAWQATKVDGTITNPTPCPYMVNTVNQVITFSADVKAPQSTTTSSGSVEQWPIVSQYDNLVVVPSQSRFWTTPDPQNPNGRIATLTGNYISAHAPAGGPGPWSRDTGYVDILGAVAGFARSSLSLSGAARSWAGLVGPGYVDTPAQVLAQSAAAFRAVTLIDTNSYHYTWQVDGVNVSGNDDADYAKTWSTPGNHTVRALAAYVTGVETLTVSITVKLNVSFTGPSSVKQGCPAQWIGSVLGHTNPVTWWWTLNGVHVGTNSSTYGATVNWTGNKTLALQVTDNAGFTNTKSMTVTGTTTGTCQATIPMP